MRYGASRGNAPRLHRKITEAEYVNTMPPSGKTEVFVELRVEKDFTLDDSDEVIAFLPLRLYTRVNLLLARHFSDP